MVMGLLNQRQILRFGSRFFQIRKKQRVIRAKQFYQGWKTITEHRSPPDDTFDDGVVYHSVIKVKEYDVAGEQTVVIAGGLVGQKLN